LSRTSDRETRGKRPRGGGAPQPPYDPFNPENVAVLCPSCQGKRAAAKLLQPAGPTTRRCDACGRVENWLQPSRAVHGDRRYKRLLARQRQKFGDLDVVLPQWVADPEAEPPS
jgi:hypothetical protein